MKTLLDLSYELMHAGVACLSIRPPDKRSTETGWIANVRFDDIGWRTGRPSETLEDALRDVLRVPLQEDRLPVDDMEDLLG